MWIHSHEEDRQDVRVYRTEDFEFPQSRFRHSFDIHEDGTFVETRAGANDQPIELTGSWVPESYRKIQFDYDDSAVSQYRFRIKSLSSERLQIVEE